MKNKIVKKNIVKSWRQLKLEKKALREENLIKQIVNKHKPEEEDEADAIPSKPPLKNQIMTTIQLKYSSAREYTEQCAESGITGLSCGAGLLLGFETIARAASISCVDEIVVFDEYVRLTPNQVESYYNGNWQADKPFRDDNPECVFHMARILEYLECPQYLRKMLFPLHKSLGLAGVLNPLDCPHHLRATDLSIPYREGIILNKPVKAGRGPLCDVGLDKELQLESPIDLPPMTRVTVELTNTDSKGIYWGYNVRIAGSLSEALHGHPEYDYIIGTSEHGTPIEELSISTKEPCRILLVFGGLKGLEAAIEADEKIETSDPEKAFQYYVSIAAGQGSRTIRTEEAVLMTLGIVKSRLDFPYSF